jgi:hypothetical protein
MLLFIGRGMFLSQQSDSRAELLGIRREYHGSRVLVNEPRSIL